MALAKKSGGPNDQTVNNPVAISDRDTGAVHLLYCVEYMRCFYIRSDDDGVTWSRPVEITATFEAFKPGYNWKVIATGPGHGIQLRQGRLLVPVWLSTSQTSPHGPTVAATIYSDDHGRTWQRGELVTPEQFGPNEAAVVELSDGGVLLNARQRSAAPHRLIVTSRDGISGWTKPRFDPVLTEPVCMAGLVMLPATGTGNGSRLLFTNPASGNRERKANTNESQVVELAEPAGGLLLNMRSYFGRSRRTHSASRDGGLTWSAPVDQPELVEPVCQASILRQSWPQAGGPGLILFANPADPKARVALTVRSSSDDGKSWPGKLLLHAGPAAYSCLVRLNDTTAGCLYECGDKGPYEKITFKIFSAASVSP